MGWQFLFFLQALGTFLQPDLSRGFVDKFQKLATDNRRHTEVLIEDTRHKYIQIHRGSICLDLQLKISILGCTTGGKGSFCFKSWKTHK